ncbi:DUF6059 family protein [Polymorphospora sp. NPDC051019]|uniref:DUF6059 family protein n=1 Tax=Polymorphospora sp. NPDC051019 TaxID=3155725 RepID=UPI003423D1EB
MAGKARWLLRELGHGIALFGAACLPGAALHVYTMRFHAVREEVRRREASDVAQPPAGHPERVVPYAVLTDQEREYLNRLAGSLGTP